MPQLPVRGMPGVQCLDVIQAYLRGPPQESYAEWCVGREHLR